MSLGRDRGLGWYLFRGYLVSFPFCDKQSRRRYVAGEVSFLEYIFWCDYGKDILGARSIRSWTSGFDGDVVLTLLEVGGI